jgi:hypothetical protein
MDVVDYRVRYRYMGIPARRSDQSADENLRIVKYELEVLQSIELSNKPCEEFKNDVGVMLNVHRYFADVFMDIVLVN